MWALFSALRGPDSGDSTLKTQYTAKIRAYLFGIKEEDTHFGPFNEKTFVDIGFEVNTEKITKMDAERSRSLEHNHFNSHVRKALRAISNFENELKGFDFYV